jgi:hypothetical protein
MGIRLPANSKVVMQIHYPGGISGQTDSTKLLLKLSSSNLRPISIDAPLEHLHLDNNQILIIPANTTRTFTASYQVPSDISVLGVGPHMHLIGKSIFSYGVTPSNDTIPFINIPEWDFHWQGIYSFPKVIKIPAGTILHSSAYYDNTTANLNNPNNPPQFVHLGEATTDEMMLVYFAYTYYLPGDENIIIDSSLVINTVQDINNNLVSTPQLYDPVPNPANEKITFQYFLPVEDDITLTLTDATGRLIQSTHSRPGKGLITSQLITDKLSSGIYFITLKAGEIIRVKRFLKN